MRPAGARLVEFDLDFPEDIEFVDPAEDPSRMAADAC
jgi:hypothetical protein